MWVLTVLIGNNDYSDQQGGTQNDQANGGETVWLSKGQWANWSKSRTNWEKRV